MECQELNCSGLGTTHDYGDPSCDWALDSEGGVIGKSEAEA